MKVLKGLLVTGLSLGLLAGCSGESGNGENLNTVEASEEKLSISFIEAKVTEDKDRIVVDIETNLPDSTEIQLIATNEEDIEYKGSAVVSNGKLSAELEGKTLKDLINGTYEIVAKMQVSDNGLNSAFYDKYGDASSVEDLIDWEVADPKYTSGYIISFGIIGEIEITERTSLEEYNKALEEAKKAEEAERKAEEEQKAKEEEERKAEAKAKAEEEAKAKEEEEARKAEEEKKAKEEAEAKAKAEEESKISKAFSLLEENFSAVANVEYDENNKAFVMLPTDPIFAEVVNLVKQGEMLTEWDQLCGSMLSASWSINEFLGDGYSIVMLNPNKTSEVILEVSDGSIIKDIEFNF